MENELKQRNGCISFWLWVTIIVNIAMIIYYAVTMFSAYSSEAALGLGLCSIFGAVNVLSAILLLRWNKIGFYMMVVSTILAIVVNICVLKMEPVAMIGSLFAIVIWWAILQMKNDGVSAWSQLQSGWDGKHCRHLYQLFAVIGIALFVLTLIAFGYEHNNPLDNILSDDEEVVAVVDDEVMSPAAVDSVVVVEEDVVEVVEEESVEEKNLRFLKNIIAKTNDEYPQKLDEGLVMQRVYLDGDYVTYQAECNEDILDMDLLEMNKSMMEDEIRKNLSSSDPAIKMFKNTCIKANKGIKYKYIGGATGQSFSIRFSCNQLKNI